MFKDAPFVVVEVVIQVAIQFVHSCSTLSDFLSYEHVDWFVRINKVIIRDIYF